MLDQVRKFALSVSLLLFVVLIGLFFMVKSGNGHLIGFPDMEGEIETTDFATLVYEPNKVGYLACSEGLCPLSKPDQASFDYSATPKQLRNAIIAMVDQTPLMKVRHMDLRNGQFDITVKHRTKKFPDLVTLKITPTKAGASLILYSRAIIGDPSPALDAERAAIWSKIIQFNIR